MHLISRKMLKEFWATHPDAENPLKAWAKEVERAQWANSAALKAMYGSASILDDKRVVFNICGNKYRLVVWVNYRYGRVMTRWIGSHKEYDGLKVETL
jgi:mRNA interferase HigB